MGSGARHRSFNCIKNFNCSKPKSFLNGKNKKKTKKAPRRRKGFFLKEKKKMGGPPKKKPFKKKPKNFMGWKRKPLPFP